MKPINLAVVLSISTRQELEVFVSLIQTLKLINAGDVKGVCKWIDPNDTNLAEEL